MIILSGADVFFVPGPATITIGGSEPFEAELTKFSGTIGDQKIVTIPPEEACIALHLEQGFE